MLCCVVLRCVVLCCVVLCVSYQWLQRLGNLVPGAPSIFHRVLGVQRVLDALHMFYSKSRWDAGTAVEPGLPSLSVYGKLVAKVLANMLPPPDLSTSEGRAAAIAMPSPRYTEVKAIMTYCFSRSVLWAWWWTRPSCVWSALTLLVWVCLLPATMSQLPPRCCCCCDTMHRCNPR